MTANQFYARMELQAKRKRENKGDEKMLTQLNDIGSNKSSYITLLASKNHSSMRQSFISAMMFSLISTPF